MTDARQPTRDHTLALQLIRASFIVDVLAIVLFSVLPPVHGGCGSSCTSRSDSSPRR